jgi:hypothetical protein
MAKFKVIIERVETIVKQAQIIVHATSADEARHQIHGSFGQIGCVGFPTKP